MLQFQQKYGPHPHASESAAILYLVGQEKKRVLVLVIGRVDFDANKKNMQATK